MASSNPLGTVGRAMSECAAQHAKNSVEISRIVKAEPRLIDYMEAGSALDMLACQAAGIDPVRDEDDTWVHAGVESPKVYPPISTDLNIALAALLTRWNGSLSVVQMVKYNSADHGWCARVPGGSGRKDGVGHGRTPALAISRAFAKLGGPDA